MVKYAHDGSSTFSKVRFAPPLTSYTFVNDGAAAVTVNLDGAILSVPAGSVVGSSAGERLSTFAVILNASSSAWRFLGSDDA